MVVETASKLHVEEHGDGEPLLLVQGLGILTAVAGIFAGAMLDQVWARVAPRSHEQYSVPAASGLIAGEALVAVAIPILVTLGLMRL